ncbi:MAG: glycosyltransferase family 2 protein [Verrucomicrobiota bacterium]|jgi:dolichol-phosphate mannosyltransferase
MPPEKMISVVIPTYKSEPNLSELIRRLTGVLSKLPYSHEIIFVNDNSPDDSCSLLKAACQADPNVKLINLSRNFGQQIATSAGLRYSSGDAVIVMDDDLQDPPEFIPELVGKWDQGNDVVYAIRTNRKEGFFKKLGYKMFYLLLSRLSPIRIPQDSGDFGLLDRKIVEILNSMPERARLIRGLRAWVGFRQTGVECERGSRFKGEPAYSLMKMIRLSMNGIFAFSDAPLQLSSTLGFVVSLIAFLGMILTIIQRIMTFFFPSNPVAVWPGFSTIVLAILFLGGVQLIGIGILGEYVARIYNEVKQRPMFLVRETVNLPKKEQAQT